MHYYSRKWGNWVHWVRGAKMKSEIDLGDHLASGPSCDDLVSIRRPVVLGRTCNTQQRATEDSEPFLRTLMCTRAELGRVPQLAVTLSFVYLGCAWGRLIAHKLARRRGRAVETLARNPPPFPPGFPSRQRPCPNGRVARLYRRIQPRDPRQTLTVGHPLHLTLCALGVKWVLP